MWQEIKKQNFTNINSLLDFLEWDPSMRASIDYKPNFLLNLPRRLAEKIDKKNLNDPILKQFLPTNAENTSPLHFGCNPVGDKEAQKTPKLLHKYKGRALLLTTSACAMHCRYCFRRHFPYEREAKGLAQEMEVIRQDPSLSEIILSGGDPLSLSDYTLENLIKELGQIPHIKRLRFHTRFPIGIPERISENLLKILSNASMQIIFVIHCNHPLEFDHDVKNALKKIQKLGIPVLNQAVLLKGVNDNIETLRLLCELLANCGILSYYLHQLDQVTGAHHFEVEEALGKTLVEELSKSLSGYAVPQYVKECAGIPSKTKI